MTPTGEVAAERRRQVEIEGWTLEHDDEHVGGEMMQAAMVYLSHGTDWAAPMCENGVPVSWPWHASWFKPKDRRRNLVRAGALMLAEKERLQRLDPKRETFSHIDDKLHVVYREVGEIDQHEALRRNERQMHASAEDHRRESRRGR